jgi:undecaprenyl phosphate N,N'-diacetylbacillosamine 1-phosphate transferase
LDEFPQLLNVIKGDMILIFPTSLLPKHLALHSEEQKRRHEIRPGITGWAQVNGRNAIGWNQKFRYDVYYVDNQSFLLDMKIIILTVKKVLVREDISSTTSATMEVFTGNKLSDE